MVVPLRCGANNSELQISKIAFRLLT